MLPLQAEKRSPQSSLLTSQLRRNSLKPLLVKMTVDSSQVARLRVLLHQSQLQALMVMKPWMAASSK